MRLVLPSTNPDTDTGFYIITANLLLMSVAGAISIIGIEVLNAIFLNNLKAAVDTIKYSIEEFELLLKTNADFTKERRYQFRNILQLIQDVDRLKMVYYLLNIREI